MERAMIIERYKRLNSYSSELRASRNSLRETRPVSLLASVVAAPASRGDEVVVSPEALLFSRAKDALRALPDTREELVQSLREEIQNGSYSVNSVLMSEKLMEAVARFARL
jgi:flagellar biosynthesis anti-sigma factor FlgM